MDLILTNKQGESLDHTFTRGSASLKKNDWLVILGHGLTGNKDRPLIVDTAKALNACGFDTLAISFSGNGNSEGDFRCATISKETADISSVIDTVSEHYTNICYIGHSMGAAVGLMQASRDTRINAMVSLAGMVHTKTFAETEFGHLKPDEACMWDDPECPLSSVFMHDMCETVKDVSPLAKLIQIPWLLLHGTADDVVLPQDTECIQEIKGVTVDCCYIHGADHSFSESEHRKEALNTVVNWLATLVK